jgi:hypothetical protein
MFNYNIYIYIYIYIKKKLIMGERDGVVEEEEEEEEEKLPVCVGEMIWCWK